MCDFLYFPILSVAALLSFAGFLWSGSKMLLHATVAIVVLGAIWVVLRPSVCG